MLESLLRSGAEVKVLGIVLFEEGLHLREIARRAGVSSREAKRELDILTFAGILTLERKGNMCFYHSNSTCPFLGDLRQLYLKTEGAGQQLKKALSKLRGVDYAFIFGSFAKGDFSEKSDIDVMIIGNIPENELSMAIFRLQKRASREINFILWTRKDFAKKLAEGGSFINSALKGKKIWVAGDADEFGRIAKEKDG